MKSGTHGDKFWAATFVKIDSPEKDDDGEVILKSNPARRGRHEAESLEKIPRRTEVAYWSDISEADARTKLTAYLVSKNYDVDASRTSQSEMGVEKSVRVFARRRGAAELEVSKKVTSIKTLKKV